jgi:hypothetical protein
VCSLPGSTPPNYLPKWDSTNRVLCNSIVHDNGSAVGIPVAVTGSYFNVANTTDTVAASFSSTDTNTVAVVKATYNTNSSNTFVRAVYGYSKYNNGTSDDGMGGWFEGGASGVYALGSGTGDVVAGITGEAKNGNYINIGVSAVATDTTSAAMNIGVLSTAEKSADVNVALAGISQGANATANNSAVLGMAGGSQFKNIGGRFEAIDTFGLNYGVYGQVSGSGSNYYAGYFDGDVHTTGNYTRSSDAKLKSNIQPAKEDSIVARLLRLEPKTYEYNRSSYPYLSLPEGKQYGLIAQEVEQVFPELVKDIVHPELKDLKGNVTSPQLTYKGLDYMGIIPLLISAVKTQQTKIDSLNEVITDRLTALENRLNGCCGTGAAFKSEGEDETAVNKINVELTSVQVIVLEQNVPNPFAEQTSIQYYLPEDISGAQMIFTDMLGNTIKTADVKSGYGVVTVFAANLSSGQYSYALVVNGKVVETKRMVKQK